MYVIKYLLFNIVQGDVKSNVSCYYEQLYRILYYSYNNDNFNMNQTT